MEKNLQQTNILRENTAPEYVQVKAVRCVGVGDVYNMEVEGYHNFSVNGGVIVHNCMDDLRYFVQEVFSPDRYSFE